VASIISVANLHAAFDDALRASVRLAMATTTTIVLLPYIICTWLSHRLFRLPISNHTTESDDASPTCMSHNAAVVHCCAKFQPAIYGLHQSFSLMMIKLLVKHLIEPIYRCAIYHGSTFLEQLTEGKLCSIITNIEFDIIHDTEQWQV
jgi:hypothetical protein